MHAFKNAAKRAAKQLANKTLAAPLVIKAANTAPLYYVVSTRGAYAMQTGFCVNAKNIKVYAVFDNALIAANYVANNKMHLYAAVVMQ